MKIRILATPLSTTISIVAVDGKIREAHFYDIPESYNRGFLVFFRSVPTALAIIVRRSPVEYFMGHSILYMDELPFRNLIAILVGSARHMKANPMVEVLRNCFVSSQVSGTSMGDL